MPKFSTRRKTANLIVEYFMGNLDRATRIDQPFEYWLIDDVLPEDVIDDTAALPFAPPANPGFDGQRETNNSTRVFFTPANQSKLYVCWEVASIF